MNDDTTRDEPLTGLADFLRAQASAIAYAKPAGRVLREWAEAVESRRAACSSLPDGPNAWGRADGTGQILDCICPEEHARAEGDYTIPLFRRGAVSLPDGGAAEREAPEDEEAIAEEALVYELSAALMRLDGNEGDPHTLLWCGGTIPEPWGDAWQRYEPQARKVLDSIGAGSAEALVALVKAPSALAAPSAQPSGAPEVQRNAEEIQWRNIRKVVRALADFCFGSPSDPKWGTAHVAMTTSLTANDGIGRIELEPLPATAPTPSGAPADTTKATPDARAIEHAEYMATDAERLLEVLSEEDALRLRREESDNVDEDDIHDAETTRSEAMRSLRSGIYEFRKRRDRAALAGAPAVQEGEAPRG